VASFGIGALGFYGCYYQTGGESVILLLKVSTLKFSGGKERGKMALIERRL
jgi:hypothetical protein